MRPPRPLPVFLPPRPICSSPATIRRTSSSSGQKGGKCLGIRKGARANPTGRSPTCSTASSGSSSAPAIASTPIVWLNRRAQSARPVLFCIALRPDGFRRTLQSLSCRTGRFADDQFRLYGHILGSLGCRRRPELLEQYLDG